MGFFAPPLAAIGELVFGLMTDMKRERMRCSTEQMNSEWMGPDLGEHL